jgi:hypothetical protein
MVPEFPPSQPRKPRSKCTDPKAQHVGFYPAHWRTVIDDAKIRYRAWILSVDAFPSQEDGKDEARLCLNEALSAYRDKGNEVEDGI